MTGPGFNAVGRKPDAMGALNVTWIPAQPGPPCPRDVTVQPYTKAICLLMLAAQKIGLQRFDNNDDNQLGRSPVAECHRFRDTVSFPGRAKDNGHNRAEPG